MRPVTREQWQDAVDAADVLARITTAKVLLFLELARVFGLLDENGEVNTQACFEVIEDGRSRGVTPSANSMQRFITD